MREQENLSSTVDGEVEIFLKEYEVLRTEINTHIASQTQLTTVAIILLGGITAAIPFLVSLDSQGLHLRFPLIFLVLMLLIISILFTSLQWASMAHDIQMAYIAQYIHRDIRTKTILALRMTASVFNWEGYRNKQMYPKSQKFSSLAARLAIVVLSIAQYIPMSLPAVVSLLAAGLIYLTNFSILAADAIGWFDISLFIFGLFYFLASIPCALYITYAYEEIPSQRPFT